MTVDILKTFSKANMSGAKFILVLTDNFLKNVACAPLQRNAAEIVARAVVENWILTFGAPDCPHIDQGTSFCSEHLLEVCKIFGIEKKRTTPYHTQANGMVERQNRVIEDVISKYCASNSGSWEKKIPYLNFV